jgi:GNAT superfamily N-acetyltransferase
VKPTFRTERTDAQNEDFKSLVEILDAELTIRDGDDHDFYHQFNGLADIKYVVLVYQDNIPVACGAIKKFDHDTMEIKRMFVPLAHRRHGYAMQVLLALQAWALELGFTKCILETGYAQPEAIALYHKAEFKIIENYGQYAGIGNSICFGKDL